MRKAILMGMAALALGACGDDDPIRNDPDLTRADVAGQYEMTALTFDPQGSLPQMDLLARLDSANLPDLIVASNEDSLQLVFRDPDGGLVRIVPGAYALNDDGLVATLANSSDPARLLLPRVLGYAFTEADGTLSFTGQVSADTSRLFVIVPEWSGEPVTSPLPGTLHVEWTR